MRTSLSSFFMSWLVSLTLFAHALPQITRSGRFLYDPSGNRFFIKGVAYQPQGELAAATEANTANGGFPEPSSFFDPLSSPANCTRDLPYLRQLGVNAVRVYSVNASLNHDACMAAFEAAGIYVMLDISLPLNGSIDRSSPSWSTNLLNEYTNTINAFSKYPNILAYNIGNEVINQVSNTNAAPYVKAAARDTKAYLRGIGSQTLVGYAAVDGEANFRTTLAEYLTCGNESIVVDLYGLNNYEWCGDASYNNSGWNVITPGFAQLPVATFMSEYGCITSPPRLWTEVRALFAPPVSDVFSGGVAFSYFPTQDNYGMVTFSADGNTVTTSQDFTRLSTQYNATTPPTGPARSSAAFTPAACPAINGSLLASTTLPPTPDESVCNCINLNSLACRTRDATANQPNIVGSLTDFACQLLGSSNSGATCEAIGGNGTSGVYGPLSFCSPAIKLSYAMSAYYEFNPIATSCDFGGNATLASNRPNTAQDAAAAASSCIAQERPGGVFTVSPSASVPVATGTGSSANTNSNRPSGASSAAASGASSSRSAAMGVAGVALGQGGMILVGLMGSAVVGVMGAGWVLL